jgi:hypothetical protein
MEVLGVLESKDSKGSKGGVPVVAMGYSSVGAVAAQVATQLMSEPMMLAKCTRR